MLNKAIELAKTLDPKQEHRHACIITDKRGRILSKGKNSYSKTHPRMAYYCKKVGIKNKLFLHSELDAIIKLKGVPYTIYIARVNKKGEPLNSMPCPICASAIYDMKIKEVVHT